MNKQAFLLVNVLILGGGILFWIMGSNNSSQNSNNNKASNTSHANDIMVEVQYNGETYLVPRSSLNENQKVLMGDSVDISYNNAVYRLRKVFLTPTGQLVNMNFYRFVDNTDLGYICQQSEIENPFDPQKKYKSTNLWTNTSEKNARFLLERIARKISENRISPEFTRITFEGNDYVVKTAFLDSLGGRINTRFIRFRLENNKYVLEYSEVKNPADADSLWIPSTWKEIPKSGKKINQQQYLHNQPKHIKKIETPKVDSNEDKADTKSPPKEETNNTPEKVQIQKQGGRPSTNITINKGEDFNLEAVSTPFTNQNVKYQWTCSDKSILAIGETGTKKLWIKGKKAGTVTVTLKETISNKSATCTITVKEVKPKYSPLDLFWKDGTATNYLKYTSKEDLLIEFNRINRSTLSSKDMGLYDQIKSYIDSKEN